MPAAFPGATNIVYRLMRVIFMESFPHGRRDCTKLVDGVLKQVDVVRDLSGDVPVTGALCFIEADWPLIRGPFSIRGVHVLWPKRLAKVLAVATAGDVDVAAIREAVSSRFRYA